MDADPRVNVLSRWTQLLCPDGQGSVTVKATEVLLLNH